MNLLNELTKDGVIGIDKCQLPIYNANIDWRIPMQVEIDKFGRLIIPKAVRNHLGIGPGSVMELLEQNHQILLKPIDQKTSLKREGGVLVYTGSALDDIENAIDEDREDRLGRLY